MNVVQPKFSSASGMTFPEVMVAVTILTMVGGAMVKFTSSSTRFANQLENSLEAKLEARTMLDRVRTIFHKRGGEVSLGNDMSNFVITFGSGTATTTLSNICQKIKTNESGGNPPTLPASGFADCPKDCNKGYRPVIRISDANSAGVVGNTLTLPSAVGGKYFGAKLCALEIDNGIDKNYVFTVALSWASPMGNQTLYPWEMQAAYFSRSNSLTDTVTLK